jgi:dolichyl-phosphate beta-glucosyltransferase
MRADISKPRGRVTLVVPCYNEAARLQPSAFVRFAEREPDVHFVFVDDGSRDATRAMLLALCRSAPERFELVVLAENRGQGEAVRAGIQRAFARGDEYVGFWDADLAAPLSEVPRFIDLLDRDDRCLFALGSRRRTAGAIERHPLRHLLGRLFALVARAVLGIPLHDTQCGAKFFRRSPEVDQLFARPFISRWIFDVELIARLIRCSGSRGDAQLRLAELPLRSWREVAGSRLRVADFARAPFEMLRIGRELYREDRSPRAIAAE